MTHTLHNITAVLRHAAKSAVVAIVAVSLSACGSDFLEEYSQDLSRVRSADDLNELLMGDCLLPLGYFTLENSMFTYRNPNYAVLHFMGDELDENISVPEDPDNLSATETFYPYFTWQRDCFVDYQGRNSLESNEEKFWSLAYEKIGNCNMVIAEADNLDPSNDDDKALVRHVVGECHYLRASYYLMLVNLYGNAYTPSTAAQTPGVPVKTSAEIEDKEYQRASVAEVYQQIVSDLTAAEQALNDVAEPQSIYHVGLNTVYILRSRVALYMHDWQTARDYASRSLQLSSYLQDMRGWTTGYPISAENQEVLYSNGSSMFGNYIFDSPGRRSSWRTYSPSYTISDHLVSLYDDNDGRKHGYITDEDDPNYHCWSYRKIDNSTASYGVYKTVSDVFAIRTPEAYLNLAEADAHLGQDAEANQMLNTLRRHRITDVENVSLSGSALVQMIREERERELCLEGHRWFDLRRYQVDEQYPFSKTIEHTMTWYVYRNYMNLPSQINYYRLEPGDAAYTLNIPKTVRDFQTSIGSNERPDRQPFKSVVPDAD